MRISAYEGRAKGDGAESAAANRVVHLRLLLRQPSDREVRPCPGCAVACACARRSTTCCCGCAPDCPNVPAMLTSDPERYRLEPRVTPLVYALTCLRVVETCWSCEGHADEAGKVIKSPQVWFYAEDPVYPMLIAQHAQDLHVRKRLRRPWRVDVLPYSACDCTTFALRPVSIHGAGLRELQDDLDRLAENLVDSVRRLARDAA